MRASSLPILTLLLAGAAATAALAIGACADPDTQTPSCDNNVGPYGIAPDPSGCESFAVCASGDPSTCCVAADGGPLGSDDLATCLHDYGDPSCAYLIVTTTLIDGGNGNTANSYACSATMPPDGGSSDGG